MKVKLLQFTQEPEKICALAAGLCYSYKTVDELAQSFDKEKIEKLLSKVISSGHYSVLEHASFTFGIEGVSRALLAQLTRHRIASFSVQSQRYVKFKNTLEFIVPESIKKNAELLKRYNNFLIEAENLYKEILSAEIPAEDARFILPNASATKIIFTMNARELRHFFSLRTCNRAQWEIREMACRMLSLVKQKAPLLFNDAGPNCIRESCHETFTCGKSWKKI
ncbi:MAG: FAD-dependent thymidylate synthase [Endomicrobium sp.]|jgi:thymidylate synthase (FAD)|uniref:FAD-dependent thymidylate synthase n=1 Tax=Candidatus Endomicrobiellum cubanum TaxID=3242325 RepID=UPI0028259AD3|nr:FAD-dependent thymidylate synthase [Endomicrobium sp.]